MHQIHALQMDIVWHQITVLVNQVTMEHNANYIIALELYIIHQMFAIQMVC
jgi:hypothetical protein